MNCVILAAGIGSRLGTYTNDIPKAMVSLRNQRIIDSQLNLILKEDIEDIYIVTGYKSNVLQRHVLENYGDRVKLIINHKYNSTNSAFSWLLAAPFLMNDSVIHLNCDILFSKYALKKLITKHNELNESVVCCRSDLYLDAKMEQVLIEKNKIKVCVNNYSKKLDGKAFGMCIFNKSTNKSHLKIISHEISKGNCNENFFKVIRTNCLNDEYHTLWLDKQNIQEFNYVEELEKYNND